MIDPVSITLALTGIQKAVKMVKHASQTAQDVASLGPVIGNLFSARDIAVKSVEAARDSGNDSNMGLAIKIEMELEKARQLESELQMLFMQSGKIDVWNKIKERAGKMDKADKFAEQAKRDREKAKKEEMDEALTIVAVVFLVIALGVFGYFVFSEVQDAKAAAKPAHHRKP